MDTTFVNSEDSKNCSHHKSLMNLSDKLNLKNKDKYVVL